MQLTGPSEMEARNPSAASVYPLPGISPTMILVRTSLTMLVPALPQATEGETRDSGTLYDGTMLVRIRPGADVGAGRREQMPDKTSVEADGTTRRDDQRGTP